MPIDFKYSVLIIAISTAATFFTRAFPFLLFGRKKPSKTVLYVGSRLPSAVIAILVVYCLCGGGFDLNTFVPKLIAGLAVVLLHIWKRNNLLSIGLGTVIYMALVQLVFV